MVLYDSKEYEDSDKSLVRSPVEIVFNYLGLLVEYWDIQKGLPDQAQMEKFLGMISWFYNPVMKQPHLYAQWVINQINSGRKMVIFGNFGAYIDEENELRVKEFKYVFQAMGLKHWDIKMKRRSQEKT